MSKAVNAAPTVGLSAYGYASTRPAPATRLMSEFAHDFHDGIDINLDSLEHKLERAPRIAFIYAVTVNNPSCTILSNGRRRALLHVAQRLSVPIFFDLAYELLLHDPQAEPFESVLPEDDSGLAYEIGTLSKVIAPALRIGYMLGPAGSLMSAMIQKTSDAGF